MKNLSCQLLRQIALLLLGLMQPSTLVLSQSINFANSGGQGAYTKHFQVGRTIPANEFSIKIVNPPTTELLKVFYKTKSDLDAPFSLMSATPAPIGQGGNLKASWDGTKVIITSLDTITATTNGYLEIKLNTDAMGDKGRKVFNFVVRQPNDIVFVLDRSGSMGCDCDEDSENNWPACTTVAAGTSDRWTRLKTAVTNFVNKMADNPGTSARVLPTIDATFTGDRMSVLYFPAGTATTTGLTLNGVNTFKSSIGANMNTAATSSLPAETTSIGNGMFKAISSGFGDLTIPGHRRALFLFTDGKQNGGLWMKTASPNEGRRILDSLTHDNEVMSLESQDINPIEIFSVGLVPTPNGGSTLSRIADGSLQHFNIKPGEPEKFVSDLSIWAFNQFFSGASPQVIGRQSHQAVTSNGVTDTFVCNDNPSRVIIEAYFSGPVGGSSYLSIKKDGVDVTPFAKIDTSDYILTAIFDLDTLPTQFSQRGVWSATVIPPSPVDVQIFATADDHKVRFDGFLPEAEVRVGDTINPTVNLSLNQAPMIGADVQAIIVRPAFDLGDLLAQTETPDLPSPSIESNGCDGQKLSYLLATDSVFREKATAIIMDTIRLNSKGKGTYTNTYTGIQTSGVHKIIYWIRNNSEEFGLVERIKEQTLYVHFGDLDVNSSEHSLSVGKDGSYYFGATFRPAFKDPQGNIRYIGPGFGNNMRVEGADHFSSVDDDCRGGYTLNFSDFEPDPNIKVYVDEYLVYQGPALAFDPSYTPNNLKPWGLSLHVGLTAPTTQLDSLGLFVEADLTRRINDHLDIEALLGYYGFSGGFNILGASLLAGYRIHLATGLYLRPAVGAGYFKPKNESSTAGYTGRLELVKELNSRLDGALHGAYFYLPGPNYSFLAAGLGIKYRF